MRVGVPGEFHEDRWQRTAEDLREVCAPAHTGRGRRPSDTSYRVPKRSSDRSSARLPCPQVSQWHPRVAKRASIGTSAWQPSTEALLGQGRVSKERESVPLTGLWSGSRPGLARHPRLQVVLRHPRVAKGASIGTLARGPSTEALLGQGRVSKERESAPLTGLWSGSRPGLARPPCPQMPQWHPRVAKRASDRSLARSPCPQVLQSHPGVAKGAANGTLIGVKAGNRLFLGIGFKLIF